MSCELWGDRTLLWNILQTVLTRIKTGSWIKIHRVPECQDFQKWHSRKRHRIETSDKRIPMALSSREDLKNVFPSTEGRMIRKKLKCGCGFVCGKVKGQKNIIRNEGGWEWRYPYTHIHTHTRILLLTFSLFYYFVIKL